MKIYRNFLLSLLFTLFFTGCIVVQSPRGNYPHGRGIPPGRGNVRIYSFGELGIPRGHLPPRGSCRIWIPGRPPGQQPRPQSCISTVRNAPLGAWVITHDGARLKVSIFSRTRRGLIDEVRYYAEN